MTPPNSSPRNAAAFRRARTAGPAASPSPDTGVCLHSVKTGGTDPMADGTPGAHSLAYRVVGPVGAPTCLVLGGVTASAHVTDDPVSGSVGWWREIVGPGRAINTNHLRVVGIDYIGGFGASSNPDTHPEKWTGKPDFAVREQSDAIVDLLDGLGCRRLRALVGSSYGGMVGLAFAESYPDRLEELVLISAAHESHAMARGLRSIQRWIVEMGIEVGETSRSLEIARALAMTTYRTSREFRARFDGTDAGPSAAAPGADFPDVGSYLAARGRAFSDLNRPRSFLTLSRALDSHRVKPDRVRVPTTVVSVTSDTLVPDWQAVELVDRLAPEARARLIRIASIYGHDAFLKETEQLARILRGVFDIDFDTEGTR